MIEIKKISSALNLNKTTIVLDDNQLNNGTVNISWNNQPILFITIENNSNIDFNNFYLSDGNYIDLTHNSQVHNSCYSIAFSATISGQPIQIAELSNLNTINFSFSFAGSATGSVTVNIYSFNI